MTDDNGDYLLHLEGRDLADGWKVGTLLKPGAEGSGGHFSVCYLANRGVEVGFVKILDFRKVLSRPNRMKQLENLTRAFNYESELLEHCRGLSKVVVALESGEIHHDDAPLQTIYYIIFELADGDVRRQLELNKSLDFSWCCSAIQELFVGLWQIHGREVYHQDLKPSNILVKKEAAGIKIADFGRSHCAVLDSPNANWQVPGLPKYAPPEQLYNYKMTDTDRSRMAADLYHLGSLITFMLAGTMLTPLLISELRHEHAPRFLAGEGAWDGTFDEILPHLISAFEACLFRFRQHLVTALPSPVTCH